MKKIFSLVPVGAILIAGFTLAACSGGQNNEVAPTNQASTPAQNQVAKRPMAGEESFGLAVCEEVSKSLVEEAIGKTIEATEDQSSNSSTGCTYYTNKAKLEHILVQVSFLSADNQKKGQQTLGRTVTTNAAIPMEHFIAMQEDGQINAIYLVMTPNKFVRVDRTANSVTNDQLTNLAVKVAKIITGN